MGEEYSTDSKRAIELLEEYDFESTKAPKNSAPINRRSGWLKMATLLFACTTYFAATYFSQTSQSPHGTVQDINPPSGVTFDEYSLMINGQRIFLSSGEFHPWRLPVPALWLDVLQKMKALGFNGVSIYTHWGMIEPRQGELDFEGINDLQLFFDSAMEAGLWVTVRPGPYINAETTGGGIPGWVAASLATLRDNSTAYFNAWKPYISEISRIAARNQVDKGGPVILFQIENEYKQNNVTVPYMESLSAIVKENGVTVPITFNDVNERDNFARGPGAVELYGFDNYPLRFDCSNPSIWPSSVAETHYSYHQKVNPQQPLYFPEYQAGAFDAWGPTSPGYDKCLDLLNDEFQSVYYRNLWAQNAKMINYYMAYGGTNWGQIAFPGVYTSYDYGSPIRESRELAFKAPELKRQLTFLRSVKEFYKTIQLSNGTSQHTDNDAIHVTELRNPDNLAAFYVVRNKDTRTKEPSTFTLEMDGVRSGVLELPVRLHGREAKLLPCDIPFGDGYIAGMTAQIFFAGKVGNSTVLHAYAPWTDDFMFTVTGKTQPWPSPSASGGSVSVKTTGRSSTYTVKPLKNLVIIYWAAFDSFLIFSPPSGTDRYWDSMLQGPASNQHKNFDGIGSFDNVLVWGPYLLRSARREGGDLFLSGDVDGDTALVITSPSFKRLFWNEEELPFEDVGWGYFWSANVSFGDPKIYFPKLGELEWRMKDSLPEREATFDDTAWKEGKDDLDACKYGFCVGHVLYRGHFLGSNQIHGINLTLRGGTAFAASVYVDNYFIGTTYGNSSNHRNDVPETETIFSFDTPLSEGEHIVTILCDNMGLEESNDSIVHESIKDPRGVVNWNFVGSGAGALKTATETMKWKVQGNVLGDKLRKIVNAGGLYGEREGWHLPSFSPSKEGWVIGSPMNDGSPSATVTWFRTAFSLDIPEGYDVATFLQFPPPLTKTALEEPYRAQIYINGWQMGKYVSNLGPQSKFPRNA
ncbi:glycoside hydrolase family 35 protein [Atractiella rhizophila]|nr:glycoside hydrolase family 35 protein [Atractiella rhizophila]